MKNKYLVGVLLVCFVWNTNAQIVHYIDDMEYPNGIPASSFWWDCNVGCPLIAGPNAGHNSDYAGYIPDDGTTDVILDLGNKIFGFWYLDFWMYVPSGKEAYFNLQGSLPPTTGEFIVGNIFFNEALTSPGQGTMDWGTTDLTDDTFFNFPHDQWFKIIMNFDISAGLPVATWEMLVNNEIAVLAGTALADGNGNIPSSLGGANFFSISTDNFYYIDDIRFSNESLVGIEENPAPSFSIYPNPVQDELNIVFEEEISEIKIFDLNGRVLTEGVSEKTVSVSNLSSGVYFIELASGSNKSVQKFIKN